MRRYRLLIVGAVAFACISADASAAALSRGHAEAALRSRLHRVMGIDGPHATCVRKSSARFRCRWSGRRPDGRYKGRADVRRSHGTIVVTLSKVRKTA